MYLLERSVFPCCLACLITAFILLEWLRVLSRLGIFHLLTTHALWSLAHVESLRTLVELVVNENGYAEMMLVVVAGLENTVQIASETCMIVISSCCRFKTSGVTREHVAKAGRKEDPLPYEIPLHGSAHAGTNL